MADPRLTDLKDLGNATNDEGLALGNQFPFKVCPTVEDWDARREKLTRQLLVANGMWPIPEDRPPPVATVHGRVEREGYTVDRGERPRSPLPSYPPSLSPPHRLLHPAWSLAVFIETSPGLYVTGSLYKPSPEPADSYPFIMCPHMHTPADPGSGVRPHPIPPHPDIC